MSLQGNLCVIFSLIERMLVRYHSIKNLLLLNVGQNVFDAFLGIRETQINEHFMDL